LLYEGKSKQIFKTDIKDRVVIRFKDDTSAFYGIKRANIENKGRLTCDISSMVLEYLNANNINTHFIERVGDDGQLCRVVEHIPVEVIVRNVVAGSMAKRLGMDEGIIPENTIFDLVLRRSDLGDPLINDHHAVAIGLLSYDELAKMYEMSAAINNCLTELYAKAGITVVDFKIEFGRDANGALVLADELSPDTCRLWDKESGERMDKDRFRRDLGRVRETYEEVAERLHNVLK
jgi:phosphoribosylaminoimidazole-succinocarboxamide synthase